MNISENIFKDISEAIKISKPNSLDSPKPTKPSPEKDNHKKCGPDTPTTSTSSKENTNIKFKDKPYFLDPVPDF
jgi:hypothetical protein